MKSKMVILFIVSLLTFGSCNNKKSNGEIIKGELKSADSSSKNINIISSTTTNKDGISLKYTFNNSHGTCILELNGEIIELKQERTASGIKYSNEHFIYTNWHGETNLFKDGKLIFSDSK